MAILWSIATIATGFCSKFWQLVVVRFTVGLGEGSFAPGGNAWLSVVFPKEKRGKISGIFGIGTALGTIIGMALGGYIVTKTGDWRIVFYVFGVPGVILGVLTFFFKDYATVKESQESAFNIDYLSGWIKLFKIKSFALTVVGHSIFLLFFFTFIGWLPAFIMRGYNMNAAQAGVLLAGIFLIAVPASVLGGFLADLWLKHSSNGRAKFMLVGHSANLVVTVLLLLAYGHTFYVFIPLLVIQGIIVGSYTNQIYSIISDVIPIKYRISGFSLLNVFIFSIGALGPWIIGVISDALGGGAYGLQMGFFILLPALLIGTIFCFFMTRNYAADSAQCSDKVFHEHS
jgi:MFS family permease